MKKILLSALALSMLAANIQADEPKPTFGEKVAQIAAKTFNIAFGTVSEISNLPVSTASKLGDFATSTASKIGDFTFNAMYKYPLVAAVAISPFVPNKVAPFRYLENSFYNKGRKTLALASIAAGFAIRANLLNIIGHQYVKENNIEHNDSNNLFFKLNNSLMINKCSCNPKYEKSK
jgi:hypothetical protein